MTTTWNHRMVSFPDGEDRTHLELCEVYYTDGKPDGLCEATVGGTTPEEVREVLKKMKAATKKPPLARSDFGGQSLPAADEVQVRTVDGDLRYFGSIDSAVRWAVDHDGEKVSWADLRAGTTQRIRMVRVITQGLEDRAAVLWLFQPILDAALLESLQPPTKEEE